MLCVFCTSFVSVLRVLYVCCMCLFVFCTCFVRVLYVFVRVLYVCCACFVRVLCVFGNNNNNNNCLKSNIQCVEIRVQWTVHLGSSHMHVHAVTRVHAVTPKLVICVMYLTSI